MVKTRKRVSHACNYCKKSHLSCSQIKPCAQCERRKIPCVTNPKRRKRNTVRNTRRKRNRLSEAVVNLLLLKYCRY